MIGEMTSEQRSIERHPTRVPRAGWIVLAVVAVLSLYSALYVALTPAASQTDLSGRTWQQFAATDPEVAGLFSMQLVLVGLLAAGFSAFALVIVLVPFRRGDGWSWYALWLVPVVHGLVAARMLADAYQVGFGYAGLAGAAIIALVVSRLRRAPAPR